MNCEKAESNMVKKPKNRNILVAPNRNQAKKKKIKPSISNDNKNKKYKFDKVICLEDDIVINKNFLPFMKYYLNIYKSNPRIMNISGFSTKMKIPKNYQYDCYLTTRSMSWGQGSWRRVWTKFKSLNQNHKNILKVRNNKKKLTSAGGEDILRAMVLDYWKIIESIQVWWVWNII